MEIKITDKLKELRRIRGNTQEELASHLSISVQAVSKWERGEGFPDISLLPRIASFYDVSVDKLLGCDEIKRTEKVNDFLIKCQQINNKGDTKGWLELCRSMMKEYPNDERVLMESMYALMQNGRKENAKEIIKIGQKLILSQDHQCRNSAIEVLCYTYSAIGEKDTAVEYAKMIPVYEDVLAAVLEGQELADHCKGNIWRFCDMLELQLIYLLSSEDKEYSSFEKHKMRQTLDSVYHLIFSDGDFGFWEERLGRNCFSMSLLSAECGESKCALSELESAVEHFDKFDNFKEIDHTSLLVRGIHYESSMTIKTGEKSIFDEYIDKIDDNRFDIIRKDPRFEALSARIKKAAGTSR